LVAKLYFSSSEERREKYDRAQARIFTERIPDSTNISFMVLVVFWLSSLIISTLEKILFC